MSSFYESVTQILRIPKRTMETMSPVRPTDEEYLRKAIDAVKQTLVSVGKE